MYQSIFNLLFFCLLVIFSTHYFRFLVLFHFPVASLLRIYWWLASFIIVIYGSTAHCCTFWISHYLWFYLCCDANNTFVCIPPLSIFVICPDTVHCIRTNYSRKKSQYCIIWFGCKKEFHWSIRKQMVSCYFLSILFVTSKGQWNKFYNILWIGRSKRCIKLCIMICYCFMHIFFIYIILFICDFKIIERHDLQVSFVIKKNIHIIYC